MLDGRPFPIVGVNAYYLQQEAARELAAGASSSRTVDEVLGELAKLGVTTVRAWAFNDYAEDPVAIQRRAGELNEAGLRGLDHLIERAEAKGLKLVLALSNFWADYGGVDQYLRWNGPRDCLSWEITRAQSRLFDRHSKQTRITVLPCWGWQNPFWSREKRQMPWLY